MTNPASQFLVTMIYKLKKYTLIRPKTISRTSILTAGQIMQCGLTLIADFINYWGKETIELRVFPPSLDTYTVSY